MDPVINSAVLICQRNMAAAKARTPIADPPQDHYRDHDSERLKTAEIFISCKPECFRKDFSEWLAENFQIWKAFERRANRLWNVGAKHAGARMIGENIRYLTLLRQRNSALKVTDWFWPDCGRLYMMFYPDREKFFETRSGQSAVRSI